MQAVVQQAIMAMRERYYDPITLHDIAAEVYVSPFHFSRIFARDTGVTPGRFLTSIRLFEAKRLLLTTSMTVSDIVCSVGYTSVGTFTTRFTQLVGMTPTQYRWPEVSRYLVAVAPEFHRLPSELELRRAGLCGGGVRLATGGAISVTAQLPAGVAPATVLVGAFTDRIPQRAPAEHAVLPRTGTTETVLNGVQPGEWTVIAVAEPDRRLPGDPAGSTYVARLRRPVRVAAGRVVHVDLRLREVRPTDPPIAFTLATVPAPMPQRVRATVPSQRAVGSMAAQAITPTAA